MTNPQNQTNISPPAQPPPNNLPPQNSKQPNFKILITLGIVVVIIILLILGSFVFLSRQEQRTPDSLETNINPSPTGVSSPTLSPEEALRAPELYPEFAWEEVDASDSSSLLSEGKYQAPFSVGSSLVIITVSGKEWIYKETVSSDKREMLKSGFNEYYQKQLNKLGWDINAIEYKNKKIQGPSADGPTGSLKGYIKIAGEKMRLIAVNYYYT